MTTADELTTLLLTAREREVLDLIAAGRTNAAIARDRGVARGDGVQHRPSTTIN